MSHAASRIRSGCYEYRGYEIEEVSRFDDCSNTGSKRWNIRHLDEDSAHDAANTLKDAKATIDRWAQS